MILLETIILIVIFYFLIVFFLSRMIVPHLGFVDDKIPEMIPDGIVKKIDELKKIAGSPEAFLKLTYEFIGSKYKSERLNTFLKINYLFKSADQIWNTEGYVPCTQSNYLLKIFLIKSELFNGNQIRRKHNMVNFCLHQYLQVKVIDRWFDVDVGEKQRGMPIGKHLKWFG